MAILPRAVFYWQLGLPSLKPEKKVDHSQISPRLAVGPDTRFFRVDHILTPSRVLDVKDKCK